MDNQIRNIGTADDETLSQSLLYARKYKDWREYALCGNKFSHDPTQRSKRLNRYLLIGQAIDAFEDIPKEPNGMRFMQGDWNQGPYYAWD